MAIVQLKASWPGGFRRTVRDAAGAELRVLAWQPGESQQLEGEDLAAVAGDLGKSLRLVVFDEARGKLVPAGEPPGAQEAAPDTRPASEEELHAEAEVSPDIRDQRSEVRTRKRRSL